LLVPNQELLLGVNGESDGNPEKVSTH